MEAPVKIYLTEDNPLKEWYRTKQVGFDSIEYTRTDAFIERAYKFFKERLFFDDSWHVEGEDCMLDKVIKDFKEYIKGE